MKLFIAIGALFIVTASHAQTPREFTTRDSIKLGAEVEIKARHLRDSLQRLDDYISDHQKHLDIEYTVDVFRIEKFTEGQMDIDGSTTGMVMASNRALNEYDKLLNKYYKMLLDNLAGADKQALKTTQQNWIKFRDSEVDLARVLWKDEYSGGGTIQRIVFAARILGTTKHRVEELYYYNAEMLALD